MTVEIVVGVLTAGALSVVGYVAHRHRERAKWAGIRKDQLEKLKRLRWLKKKIATAGSATT